MNPAGVPFKTKAVKNVTPIPAALEDPFVSLPEFLDFGHFLGL